MYIYFWILYMKFEFIIISFYEYFIKRIYYMKVNLPKIIISENSGAVSTDPLLFVLHQSRLNLNHELF